MKKFSGRLFVIALFAAVFCINIAAGAVPNEKASKYLEVLEGRPEPGYLFDRFYNEWMATSTVRGLEEFFAAKAKENKIYYLLSAFFYEKEGDDERALQMYNEALKKSPDSAVLLYHKANMESYSLMFQDAETSLRTALTKNPSTEYKIRILKLLGKVYVRDGNEKKAIETWHALSAANPDDVDLQEDIIDLKFNEGLFDEAIKDCQALLAKTKDKYRSVMLSLRLGDIYQSAGKSEESLKIYRELLTKVGSGSWLEKDVLAQVERIYRMDDNLTGLQEEYGKLAEKYSKRPGVLKRRAFVLQENGDAEEAIKSFVSLIQITPGDRSNREEYISLLVNAEKYDEGAKQVKELIKQNPKDAELYLTLAHIQNKSGATDEALKSISMYLSRSSKSEFDYMRCARLLANYEKDENAMRVYRSMLKAFPDSPSARDAAASFFYRKGKKEEALKVILEKIDTSGSEHIMRIARLLMGWGEKEKAYELLKKHEAEYGGEIVYIGELYRASSLLDKKVESLNYAIKRIGEVARISEFEQSISECAAAARLAEQDETLITKIEASEKKTLARTALLAELLEKAGDGEKADKIIDAALQKDPGNLLLNVQKTRLARYRNDWTQAMKITESLLKHHPTKKSYLVRKLVEYAERADAYEPALKWIEEWKKVSPGSMMPYMKEAKVYSDRDELDKAIKTLRRAHIKFPEEHEIAEELAALFVEDDSPEDAARIYWSLLEKTDDLSARLKYVRDIYQVSDMQGRTDKLVRHFKTRMETNKKSVFPVIALANIYRDMGNYEKRREYMMKASEVRSDDVQLLHEIASIEEREGDYQRAESTLKKAASLDKSDRSKEKLARHLVMYGDEDKGYDLIIELAGGSKMDPDGVESMVDAFIVGGKYDRALDLLEQAMSTNKKDYRLGYLRAIILEELDRTDEAIVAYMDLLSVEKELPRMATKISKMKQLQQQSYNRYNRWYDDIFPAEIEEIMNYFSLRYRVYSYKQRRGGSYYGGYYGGYGTRSVVQFPKSVDELSSFVVAHLASISQYYEEEEKKKLIQKIEGLGVSYAELKLSMDPSGRFPPTFWQDILKKYPDDDLVKCMWLMYSYSAVPSDEVKKTYNELVEHFAKKGNKNLVLHAHMSALQRNIDPEEHAKKALALLKEVEKPSAITLQSMVYMDRRNVMLSEEIMKEFNMTLLGLYEKIKEDDKIAPTLTPQIIAICIREKNYEKFIEIVNSEVEKYKSSKSKGRYSPYGHYYGSSRSASSRGNLDKGINFPPDMSRKIPNQVLMYFTDRMYRNFYGMGNVDLDQEKLWEHVDAIKHPVLRFMLAVQCEKKEEAEKILDTIIKEEGKPDLDYLLLAAAWKGHNNDFEDAVKILSRARHMAMNQQKRQMIDSSIVFWALDTGAEKGSEVFEIGKAAALRLRRYPLSRQARIQLVGIMTDYGLSKEADKIDKQLTTAVSGSRRASSYTGMGFGGSTSYYDIARQMEKAYKDGDKKKAEKLALASFRQQAKMATGAGAGMYGGHYGSSGLKQLTDTIVRYGNTDEFLALMKPPADSTSPTKYAEYAVVLSAFDRKDEAMAAYKKVVEFKPADPVANLKMAFMCAETDMTNAVKYLETAAKKQNAFLGNLIVQNLNHDVKKAVTYVPLAIRFIELTQDKKNRNMDWCFQYLQIMENSYYRDNIRLQPLFNRNRNRSYRSSREESEESKELEKKRYKVYCDFCDVLMDVPDIQDTAFSKKLMLMKDGKMNLDKMVAKAEELMTREKAGMMNAMGYQYLGTVIHNGIEVPYETPEQFYVKRAYKENKKDRVTKLLSKLEGPKFSATKRNVESIKALYDATPENFSEAAEKYIMKEARLGGAGSGPLRIVLDAWKTGPKKPSLTPLVMDYVKKGQRQMYGVGYGMVGAWGGELVESEGEEAAVKFLNDVRKEMIGDLLTKEKLDKIQRNDMNFQRINQYTYSLSAVARDKRMVSVVFKHIASEPLLLEKKDALREFFYVVNDLCRDWDTLKKLPIMNNWDDFRLYPYDNNQASILSYAVEELARSKKGKNNESKELYNKYKAHKPRTFGTGLIDVFLDSSSSSSSSRSSELLNKVYQHLGNYADKIRESDKSKQIDLFRGIQAYFRRYGSSTPVVTAILGEQAKEMYALQESLMQKDAEKDVEKLLSQRNVNDMYNYMREAGTVLSGLIKTNPAKAEEMFEKVAEVAKRYDKYNRHYSSGGNYRPETQLERLLDEISDKSTTIRELAFLCKAAQKLDVENVKTYNDVRRRFSGIISADYSGNLELEINPFAGTNGIPTDAMDRLADVQKTAITNRLAKMKEGSTYTLKVPKDEKAREYNVKFRKKGGKPQIEEIKRADKVIKNHNGEYVKVLAIGKTLENMAKEFNGAYPVFLEDSIQKRIFYNFNNEELYAMEKWLAGKPDPVYREALVQLMFTFYNKDKKTSKVNLKKIGEIYQVMMQDKNVNAGWRLNFASDLAVRTGWYPVFKEIAAITVSTYMELGSDLQLAFNTTIPKHVGLLIDAEPTEEIKQAVKKFYAQWRKNYLGSNRTEPVTSEREMNTALPLLEANLKLGNEDQVKGMLNMSMIPLASYPALYPLLLRNGKEDMLVELLEKKYADMRWYDKYPNSFAMTDQQIKDSLAKILPKFSSDDMRIMAKTVFAVMPKPSPDKSPTYYINSDKNRLKAMAKEYKAHTFADIEVKKECRFPLIMIADLKEEMKDDIMDFGDELTVQKQLNNRNYISTKIYSRYMLLLLKEGGFQKFADRCEAISKLRTQSARYDVDDKLQDYSKSFGYYGFNSQSSYKTPTVAGLAEDPAGYIAAADKILLSNEKLYYSYHKQAYMFVKILHYIYEPLEKAEAAVAELDKKVKISNSDMSKMKMDVNSVLPAFEKIIASHPQEKRANMCDAFGKFCRSQQMKKFLTRTDENNIKNCEKTLRKKCGIKEEAQPDNKEKAKPNKTDSEKIIGTWTIHYPGGKGQMTINTNGTVKYTKGEGSWKMESDHVLITRGNGKTFKVPRPINLPTSKYGQYRMLKKP